MHSRNFPVIKNTGDAQRLLMPWIGRARGFLNGS